MRKIHALQFTLGQVPIEDIQFNVQSRDDIPAVLMGLQALWCDAQVRTKIFEILKTRVCSEVSHARGWICGACLFWVW